MFDQEKNINIYIYTFKILETHDQKVFAWMSREILDAPRSELQFQVVEDIHDLIEEAQNFCDPKHAFMALARLATVTSNASDTGQVGRVVLIETHLHWVDTPEH